MKLLFNARAEALETSWEVIGYEKGLSSFEEALSSLEYHCQQWGEHFLGRGTIINETFTLRETADLICNDYVIQEINVSKTIEGELYE